ncbi:neutral/alkaline ceramidase [Actinocorallia sp. API 0066]|uniref:neutral/alkaline ceramidase n=1 Tax=Actinocorallia sp. API 0066 TaxID=2896846 RepID=UPI001E4172B5|nr:neutral/alkaline ceramidase [Actinocorallia sp. API 0066]MCD0452891.1 neutral/alkaline ceramidase [Actinocorallia sp. API 0066]
MRSGSHIPRRGRARRPFTALVLLALALTSLSLPAADVSAEPGSRYLVGRSIADVTGKSEGADKTGYFSPIVKTHGIHQRLRSRAFIIVDQQTQKRIALVVVDVNHVDDSLRKEVLTRVQAQLGGLYHGENVMITATHTHSGPGGYMHDNFYNSGNGGFDPENYEALVAGVHESIVKAHNDLSAADLDLGIGQLNNASKNRAIGAFNRNPAADKAAFPDAIDPQTTLLQFRKNGAPVGAVNWFASHGTSMTRHSTHVSGDHKGYASYHWERDVEHVDYLAAENPSFVAAFAQTNAGDMTPNLNLQPGSGPTEDQFENTRIIGTRQYEVADQLANNAPAPIDGPIDYRFTYVDMGATNVDAAYTGDGTNHSTCGGAFGVGFAAGSKEDGPGIPFLNEGEGNNPVFNLFSNLLYAASPALKACQAPKDILLRSGDLGLTSNILPVQLVRIGQLYLVGVPTEFTIVAGLRLRRTIAEIVDAPLDHVLVAGYSNGYAGYVTTPEEYDQGDYEAGHTLFGRWTLGAFQQHTAALAQNMADNEPTPITVTPPDLTASLTYANQPSWFDNKPLGRNFGDVLLQPNLTYTRGQQAKVRFVGANPNNDVKRNATYLTVERRDGQNWVRVQDDGDWSTKFAWADTGLWTSSFTVTWDIPATFTTGEYRITYHGVSKSSAGVKTPFTGTSRTFTVS